MTYSPGLFEVIRNKNRARHYSIRTEEHPFTVSNHTYCFIHYNI